MNKFRNSLLFKLFDTPTVATGTQRRLIPTLFLGTKRLNEVLEECQLLSMNSLDLARLSCRRIDIDDHSVEARVLRRGFKSGG